MNRSTLMFFEIHATDVKQLVCLHPTGWPPPHIFFYRWMEFTSVLSSILSYSTKKDHIIFAICGHFVNLLSYVFIPLIIRVITFCFLSINHMRIKLYVLNIVIYWSHINIARPLRIWDKALEFIIFYVVVKRDMTNVMELILYCFTYYFSKTQICGTFWLEMWIYAINSNYKRICLVVSYHYLLFYRISWNNVVYVHNMQLRFKYCDVHFF